MLHLSLPKRSHSPMRRLESSPYDARIVVEEVSNIRCLRTLFALVLTTALGTVSANAEEIKTVFVIAMENHNWTQPNNQFTGEIQQIYQNPNAPFINSLVNGTAFAVVNGKVVHISSQVSYATAYHNVLATTRGDNPHIHPSEPNYIWAEAGTNFGVLTDTDPYASSGGTNQTTPLHLSNFLKQAGKTWKSYQEDIDLALNSSGQLTNVPLPQDQWTVPLTSFSGTFARGYFNAYNGSNQYNYAAKHNPMVFFTDTNGGNDATPNNRLASQDRKSTRLNSSHSQISYAVFCLKKKTKRKTTQSKTSCAVFGLKRNRGHSTKSRLTSGPLSPSTRHRSA